MNCSCTPAARLLVIPGLNDSGPTHWQTWLEAGHRHAVRVVQHRWSEPDLARWAGRIASTIERAGPGPWVAVAHSFGVLALAAHLKSAPRAPIAAALLVAPADPAKWGLGEHLPADGLGCPATLVASQTDPWLRFAEARHWAQRWRATLVNLGDAGHINAESGFGPFPFARQWVVTATQRLHAARQAGVAWPASAASTTARVSVGANVSMNE